MTTPEPTCVPVLELEPELDPEPELEPEPEPEPEPSCPALDVDVSGLPASMQVRKPLKVLPFDRGQGFLFRYFLRSRNLNLDTLNYLYRSVAVLLRTVTELTGAVITPHP